MRQALLAGVSSRRNVLRGFAAAEQHHAELWAKRIRELGGHPPTFQNHSSEGQVSLGSFDEGNDSLRRSEIEESRDIANYGKQLIELNDEPSLAILKEVLADEREHYRTLGQLIRPEPDMPESRTARVKDAIGFDMTRV